ncbi:alpha-mannosidase [Paenibacillus thalictri]|uniref:Alpha-mannosidase n=1 Tax=Paenibacillus thalictri TaxID=2527873 RepID=A0A4V2J553_9BACL|nr:alpha-mannosidase [Paenibacillus thalictri]TBL81932.1 alpha-mannosidase [Paenibacillus thalictri]
MFWTMEKLLARVKELGPFRYRDSVAITGFAAKEDEAGNIGECPSSDGEWREMRIGDRWVGRDRYVWLRQEVEIPAAWHERRIVGRFDFGRTGGGNNSGFESLLYVDGQPYQGVDTNHQEVFLPQASAGTRVELVFRLWSGMGGYSPGAIMDHQLNMAELCWLDEAADDLYYTAKAALDVVQVLEEQSVERHQLLATVDQAFLQLDWSRPGSAAFYASIEEARSVLRAELEQMPKQHGVIVRAIGHTHIDVAWLWRLKHTREKAARSFSTVLRLMELFPDYVFLQTMPQLYDYIRQDYPELYEQIKERVREGRWEAGGGMWLEADCNLTSGESLVRQLLYGTRFFREEFGVECTYLWLPDVFGYSWALPQILRKSGIDTFMTTKISWNQYNRMPHDTFRWRGIDGTEILTHFITTPDKSDGWYYTYNGDITAASVTGIWEGYRDKPVNRELLLSYGYGDGGGGVNREMLELRRRLSELPGVPHVTTGRADDYFAKLHQTVAESKSYVHTWDGELYLELHRGTYTSQAYNKRMNRKLELLARETEWIGVLAVLARKDSGAVYDKNKLDQAWKIILRNQFHDIIPGSSIHEVYEDSRLEYAEAERLLLEARSAAAGDAVAGCPNSEDAGATVGQIKSQQAVIWNSSGWTRSGLALVRDFPEQAGQWTDSQGRTLESQWTEAGCLVRIPEAQPLSVEMICWNSAAASGATELHPLTEPPVLLAHAAKAEGVAATQPFGWEPSGLDTPFYKLEWNEAGQLTRIYDKREQREMLAAGERGNVLQVFEDKPKGRHEAWEIDLFYTEKMEEVQRLVSVELIESGPLRAVVRFQWSYGDSKLQQELIVYAHSARIDFRTRIDWQERRKLLKAAFTVDVRSTEATYDIQFGSVKRPTHWNTSWDYARFEVVGHQWADLSERGYGVSLLNDCKYGYDIKDNRMRLTLIKSAMVPDPTADQGLHEFTYALFPHNGDVVEGGTVQEAWDLNAPLVCRGDGYGDLAGCGSLFRFCRDHVHVDAVKLAEDDPQLVVLRFHEFAGKRGFVEVTSDMTIAGWQEANLMERPEGEEQAGGVIRLYVKPFEIKTLLVRMQ